MALAPLLPTHPMNDEGNIRRESLGDARTDQDKSSGERVRPMSSSKRSALILYLERYVNHLLSTNGPGDGAADNTRRPLKVDWLEKFMSSITMVAGFLVVAAFPLVTQDLSQSSVNHPTHFEPLTVRKLAANSVGFFLLVILLSQATKIIYLAGQEWKLTNRERAIVFVILLWVLCWHMILLTCAIMLLLFIVTAYVRNPGIAFLVLIGLIGLFILVIPWILVGIWWCKKKKDARLDLPTHKRQRTDLEQCVPSNQILC